MTTGNPTEHLFRLASLGWKTGEIAQAIGVNTSTVRRWRLGVRAPPDHLSLKLKELADRNEKARFQKPAR